ncbi:MAG: TRAP transporter large permease [Deltaproteobacteria bacterium]|nr:TRAP transporter large permease [Deltaproteobacteria bacterium]
MESLTIGIIGIIAFFVLLLIGVHIASALAIVGALGLIAILGWDKSIEFISLTAFFSVFRFELIALPLFIMAGVVAALGGLSRDIYVALSKWTTRFRAGLGMATIASCTLFGTVCGSALVTASVFAKVSSPQLRALGYPKGLAYGVVSAGGMIGMLIPPSILIVYYAILTEESVGKLLIAGISPGLLLTIIFWIGLWVKGRLNPDLFGAPSMTHPTWRERIATLPLLWPVTLVAVILVGGIISGVFDPNEAGALAVMVILLLTILRIRSIKGLIPSFKEAAAVTGMIFFIFIGGTLFSRFLTLSGITPVIIKWIIGLELSQLGMVIAMCVVYLIMGCFLDSISMLSITIPLIYPVIRTMKIDPIWFGMSVIMAIEIGLITPPFGLNIFAVKGIAERDVSLEDIFRGVLPFILMSLGVLILIIAFPTLSTILPNLMMK